jgi:serine/threonine protein kinase
LQALEGRQPGLERTTKLFSSRTKSDQPIPDYFETKYDIVKKLGHGAFADAYQVTSLENGQQSAIKKTRHEFVGYNDA